MGLVRLTLLEDSPVRSVSMPRLERRVEPPFTPDEIRALVAGCNSKIPKSMRDQATILGLLDRGLRASEFVSLRVKSVDLRTRLVAVPGKGRKQRTVRFGAKSRKSLLRYLATREEATPDSPLWVAYRKDGRERASHHAGSRQCVPQVGREGCGCTLSSAEVSWDVCPWWLRDGMDVHSLRLLMGHSSLAVLQQYLALAREEIEGAHKLHSPVDNLV